MQKISFRHSMSAQLFVFILVALLCLNQTSYAQDWQLSGNNNATESSKLGTTNSASLRIYTNNIQRMSIDGLGKVVIGNTAPNPSALFEVSSTTKGVLFPRMTQAQRDAIAFPVNGLMIFQMDGTRGLYYYMNGVWKEVAPPPTGFANTSLSNLTAPTAVNTHLLPSSPNDWDLGSELMPWKSLYLQGGYIYMNRYRFIWQGDRSTYMGHDVANATPFGSFNTVVGMQAFYFARSAANNTAMGHQAMYNTVSGNNNVAIGYRPLYMNSSGSHNIAIGSGAMNSNNDGNENVAIGRDALSLSTSSTGNVAIGADALRNTRTWNSTAVGKRTLMNNTRGELNSAFGFGALFANTEGWFNTAVGYASLSANTIGGLNTASGTYSLMNNTEGGDNTAFGYQSLYDNVNGSGNTAIGKNAGIFGTSIIDGTFVGNAATSFGNYSNLTVLGAHATGTASNQVRIGNETVTSIGGFADWTNFSDGRFKKNMNENVPGLEFIKQLRPVTYTLDVDGLDKALKTSNASQSKTSVGEKAKPQEPTAQEIAARQAKSKIIHTGFVAQEVEAAAKKLNYDFSGVDAPKNDKDFYGLRYSEFVVPLVKAVQELDAENKQLKEELTELRQMIMEIKKGGLQPTDNSSSSLEQNAPNPFGTTTTIRYNVPSNSTSAAIVITNAKGQVVKRFSLNNKGNGQVSLDGNALPAGTYNYTLWVNGKQENSKRMMIVK